MKRILHRQYSNFLHRTMNVYEYGSGDFACLIIPTEGGRFYDFESFGMISACEEVLQSGKIRFFCCDSIDREALARWDGPLPERLANEEKWVQYITGELYPMILRRLTLTQSSKMKNTPICVAGCGMGAYQAANLFFRFPELFRGLLALSGFYSLPGRLGGCLSDAIVRNSPWHQVYSMTAEAVCHLFPPRGSCEYRRVILGCGCGAWEESSFASLQDMEKLLEWKQIPAEILCFGPDGIHDWSSWRDQFPTGIKKLFGNGNTSA